MAPAKWRLRPACADDFEWAFALHRAALGEYVQQTWGWEEHVQRRMFSELFHDRSWRIIEIDSHDVGLLVVEERPDELYLALIELTPRWQNQGIGTAILGWLRDHAKETRRPLSLRVLKTNHRATALYEREGFHVVQDGPTKILMRSVEDG